jgi:hypothetical protein
MKKTRFVWAIIFLFSVSDLFECLTSYAVLVLGHSYYSNTTLSAMAAVQLNLDIVLSSILVYKLLYLRPDALWWANIAFGFSTLRLLFSMAADATLNTGTLMANAIEVVIVVLIWQLFYNHLKRILSRSDSKGAA